MENKNEQYDEEVTIKLTKGEIPLIVGAMRLGCNLEDWCASYLYSCTGWTDSHSMRWMRTVFYLIDEINKQSGNKDESVEKAYSDVIATLEEIIYKQCEKIEKELNDCWENENKRFAEKEKVILGRFNRKHPGLHLSEEDIQRIRYEMVV